MPEVSNEYSSILCVGKYLPSNPSIYARYQVHFISNFRFFTVVRTAVKCFEVQMVPIIQTFRNATFRNSFSHRLAPEILHARKYIVWLTSEPPITFRKSVFVYFSVFNCHTKWIDLNLGSSYSAYCYSQHMTWYDIRWYDVWYDLYQHFFNLLMKHAPSLESNTTDVWYDMIRYDIWYDIRYDIWYDMIYDMI